MCKYYTHASIQSQSRIQKHRAIRSRDHVPLTYIVYTLYTFSILHILYVYTYRPGRRVLLISWETERQCILCNTLVYYTYYTMGTHCFESHFSFISVCEDMVAALRCVCNNMITLYSNLWNASVL